MILLSSIKVTEQHNVNFQMPGHNTSSWAQYEYTLHNQGKTRDYILLKMLAIVLRSLFFEITEKLLITILQNIN